MKTITYEPCQQIRFICLYLEYETDNQKTKNFKLTFQNFQKKMCVHIDKSDCTCLFLFLFFALTQVITLLP